MNPFSTTLLVALLCGLLLAPVSASLLRGQPILRVSSEVAPVEQQLGIQTRRPNGAPSTYSDQQNQTTYDEDSMHLRDLAIDGNLEELKGFLDENPYLVNSRDSKGWTALHEAARHSHIEIADYLLSMRADLNAQTFHGATPLYEAEKYNGRDSTMVRYLLSMGALRLEAKANLRGGNASRQDKTLPNRLAGEGRMDELNQLFDLEGPTIINVKDASGWTPLHEAARFGHVHVARFLLDRGAEIDSTSVEGGSPVYYAEIFQGKDSDIYQFLEDSGALSIGPQQ